MSEFDEETGLHLYPISVVLSKGKFGTTMRDLGAWLNIIDVRASKTLGWRCELCGSKSRPPKPHANGRYKHTLYKRVQWHLNGRCKFDAYHGRLTSFTAKEVYEMRMKKDEE